MRCIRVYLLLICLAVSPAALAGTITAVVVYGDSLSDNGNLYAATANPPSPPYFNGRFSNGPVAVEQLAAMLDAPLYDFAWAGATTGLGNYGDQGTPTSFGAYNLPGMSTVFAATSATIAPLAATSVFVVWGGPDDFLSPSLLDGGDPLKTANRAAANLIAIVTGVQNLGAQHILVPGMPDLGLTPYFIGLGLSAQGSSLTDYYNAQLRATLPAGVIFVDTAALMRSMVSNPSAYGLTNVTQPCLLTGCTTPETYLFWDDFHPTTYGHSVMAAEFVEAIPEPATALLLALPILGLAFLRKTGR